MKLASGAWLYEYNNFFITRTHQRRQGLHRVLWRLLRTAYTCLGM